MTSQLAAWSAKVAAMVVGMSAIAAATRVNLEHSAAEPTSPIGAAIVVFGLVTLGCAIAAPKACPASILLGLTFFTSKILSITLITASSSVCADAPG